MRKLSKKLCLIDGRQGDSEKKEKIITIKLPRQQHYLYKLKQEDTVKDLLRYALLFWR